MSTVETSIIMTKIDPARVELAYYMLLSVLEDEDYTRAEIMTALAVCLGTQWNGKPIEPDMTGQFIKDITEWLAMYFAKGEKQ